MAESITYIETRTVAQQLSAYSSELVAEVGRLRALVVAFRLAANADEGGGEPALYWPDLMALIESKLPSEDLIDQTMRSIGDSLASASASTPRPAAGTPARVRRPLAAETSR